ncbi:DUF1934 domain-containing protein [Sporanaerobium hydrogeniformans]|uniref:DUF1934 domain-containing protein n=1 Tax=Sporanaerobium hydrogeniformans TaxID=3072179 RepID=UPI0015D4F215|nr:DUF1934 domain-containing protein [Sporanaerobium hydrogeniformans]
MQDVTIKVFDKQIYESHSDTNETKFKGQLTYKGSSVYITFKDTQTGVTTFIKAKKGIVSVKRMGSLQGNLEFNREMPHRTLYFTPYGEMEIQIITHSCQVEAKEKGIKIALDYQIRMQGKKISDNIYIIEANQ